jgi:hypothetical protein
MTPSLCDLFGSVLVPVNALICKLCCYYSQFADTVNSGWISVPLPSRCPPQALQAYLQSWTPEGGRTEKHPQVGQRRARA